MRALIDTGAEANLVRQNLLESGCFEFASDPIQLVAANGQILAGGTRTTTLKIEFHPYENGNFLDKRMLLDATCYEADISVDIILSYPWMAKNKIGVFPHHKALVVDEPRLLLLFGQSEKKWSKAAIHQTTHTTGPVFPGISRNRSLPEKQNVVDTTHVRTAEF